MKAVNTFVKLITFVVVTVGLTACSLFSNNGYEGGDHRGGGPVGPLTGSESASKGVSQTDVSNQKASVGDDSYLGIDHRGGGPAGSLR